MSQYKLYYFQTRGKGEPIRLLFHFKGVQFEDVRIEKSDWPTKKSTFSFGQVPVLESDGKQIAQSWSILRHLANKYDLAGKDEEEKLAIDQVSELWRDWSDAGRPYMAVVMGLREGDKEQLRNEKFLSSLERFAPHFQRLLKESGSGFFGKSGVSYVDFVISEGLFSLYNLEKELLEEKYQFLIDYFKRVHELPELREYILSRPETSR